MRDIRSVERIRHLPAVASSRGRRVGARIKLRKLTATFPWAELLTAEERDRIETETVVRQVNRGEFICRKGKPAEYWHGVVRGLIKLCASDSNGRMTTHITFAAGGWWGDAVLHRDEPRSACDAVALCDSVIACVPRETFLWLRNTNIRFNNFLMSLTAERSLYFLSLLESRRLHGPMVKVALCLTALLNPWLQSGMRSQIAISQEEIGNLVGLSRQTVNRVLRTLKESGCLDMNYRGITVLDVNRLKVLSVVGAGSIHGRKIKNGVDGDNAIPEGAGTLMKAAMPFE